MKINVETKFDLGDFVNLQSDEGISRVKMQVGNVVVDSTGQIIYVCEWINHGAANRMQFSETSLEEWIDK